MKAILYIAHGTRSKQGTREVEAWIQSIMEKVQYNIQQLCYLEICTPSIEEGIQKCVKQGVTRIEVIPLLLLKAGHFKSDIPNVLAKMQAEHPSISFYLHEPFGVQQYILNGIVTLLKERIQSFHPDDRILVVARGSSGEQVYKDLTVITTRLKEQLGCSHISSCYLAVAKPLLEEGFHEISKGAKRNIIVIPYLLFSGLLLDEVKAFIKSKEDNLSVIMIEPLSRIKTIQRQLIDYINEGASTYATAHH